MKFDYKNASGASEHLFKVQTILYNKLSTQNKVEINQITDTRPIHKMMFSPLTPKGFPDFAGHYRSEHPEYLAVNVQLGTNGPLGASYKFVENYMDSLSKEIDLLNHSITTDDIETKIMNYLILAAASIVEFIKIHPYVDGNGHISRFIVSSFLIPNKMFPYKWSIEPRPVDSQYIESMHSGIFDGDFLPLIKYFVSTFSIPKKF